MSGLREALGDIVTDVPVYGDLDRALERAERDRRDRHRTILVLAATTVVLAVLIGIGAVARETGSAPPVSPRPTPATPGPTPTRTQSPETWSDTPVAPRDGYGWSVPDPLKPVRDTWFAIVTDHLDTAEPHLQDLASSAFGVTFERPAVGSIYPTSGHLGLAVDGPDLTPLDGCPYLTAGPTPSNGTESCSEQQFVGPHGERGRIARWGRRCGAYEGGGPAPATCGDYRVTTAVARRDGTIGYVLVEGRGTPDDNPFRQEAMARAAADPRLALPTPAYTVPSDRAVASVVQDHFPGYRPGVQLDPVAGHPGLAQSSGRLGRMGFRLQVSPAGRAPTCGRSWLVDCVQRRVYGADDPTTVYVGAWDEEDWADCCPKNSRAASRTLVFVGPRHTVVVSETLVVKAHEKPIGPERDQRLIGLALDARLQ